MADKEHTEPEREETITDLDVPEAEAEDVKGGIDRLPGLVKSSNITLKGGS